MRIFVDAFIANGGNATEAAIAAGVDPDKAAVQACRWLCREKPLRPT
jgi:phage terminase small subunit